MDAILGFDIGGTKTALVLGTPAGEILRRVEFATPVDMNFDQAMERFAAEVKGFRAVCREQNLPEAEVHPLCAMNFFAFIHPGYPLI